MPISPDIPMFHRILVAVDIDEEALTDRTLSAAERIAIHERAELHALYVVPSFGMSIVGTFFPKGFERRALEAGRERLLSILAERPAIGVPYKGHVAHGTIYDEILRVARELPADLIVLAAHRPELKDYLLGPNAARVVRHAEQSVFVVRAG